MTDQQDFEATALATQFGRQMPGPTEGGAIFPAGIETNGFKHRHHMVCHRSNTGKIHGATVYVHTLDKLRLRCLLIGFCLVELRLPLRSYQQPRLPIWLGGDAEPVLRRVAKFGDGWSPFRTPPEKFPECLDFIRSQPEYDGRPIDLFFALEMLNVGAHHELEAPKNIGVAEGAREPGRELDGHVGARADGDAEISLRGRGGRVGR